MHTPCRRRSVSVPIRFSLSSRLDHIRSESGVVVPEPLGLAPKPPASGASFSKLLNYGTIAQRKGIYQWVRVANQIQATYDVSLIELLGFVQSENLHTR